MAEIQTAMSAALTAAENAGDMTKALQDLQGSIYFVIKKLKPSHVPGDTISTKCTLMIPVRFVKEHSDKFQRTLTLRSRLCREPSKVWLNICNMHPRSPEIKLGKGWKAFATRNELLVGDSLIFELKGVSEFEVYVFRGTTSASSHAPEKRSTDSELSEQNGTYNSTAGDSSSHQHLASEKNEGTVDGLSGWIAKKRKDGGEFEEQKSVQASSQGKRHDSENSQEPPADLKKLKMPFTVDGGELEEQKSVQASSVEKRHDSENSQELPPVDLKKLKMPFPALDESAHDTGSAKKEEFQEAKPSLPSFIQRLAVFNVQDAAGNTCGACFEIPFRFVKTLQCTQLLQDAHTVELQGIREESPVRTVTCAYKITQQDMEEHATRTSSLSLGWGDFVRENGLRAGQELVFTLAAESFFVVREV